MNGIATIINYCTIDHALNLVQDAARMSASTTRRGDLLLRPVQKNSSYDGEGMLWMQIDSPTERNFSGIPHAGSNPMALLAARTAPHHLGRHGDLVAWNVRDRVGCGRYVPLPGHWLGPRLAPEARALSGFIARGLSQDIAAEFRCSG